MKICYDNLEGIKLTINGVFMKNGSSSYIEMEACKQCDDPYLTLKHKPSKFCSKSCAFKDRKYSNKVRKNMSNAKKGVATKHGAWLLDLPPYETYASRLWCDEVGYEYVGDSKILTVGCVNCGKMFIPKPIIVIHRIRFLEGKEMCESRFYCSDKCKAICPVFGQHKYPKGYKRDKLCTNEELKVWREEVLKRADYKCEYCGEPATDVHHIKPQKLEPFFALDPDYGVACCEQCHYGKAHSDPECNTGNLAQVLCK